MKTIKGNPKYCNCVNPNNGYCNNKLRSVIRTVLYMCDSYSCVHMCG